MGAMTITSSTPFSPREVVARVEALLRRARWRAEAEVVQTGLQLNTETYVARWQGQVLDFNTREFRLLHTPELSNHNASSPRTSLDWRSVR